jgi:glycosyltransferase involved in cell wall biosynthesis
VATARQPSIRALHGISQWNSDNFARVTHREVTRVTGFDLPQLFESAKTSATAFDASLPSRYVLVSLDAKSMLGRKNPDGVLDVWEQVRAEFPDVTLVIKTSDLANMAPGHLVDRISRTQGVHVIDKDITRDEMTRLIAGAEVYLSLHRSEGLGLGPLEAALLSRPVVYTNYSGIVEFLDGVHYPVSYSMVRVGDSGYNNGPYPDDELWAQPDVADAVQQLRRALMKERDAAADAHVVQGRLEAAQVSIVEWAQELIAESERRARQPQRRSPLRPLLRVIKVLYRRIPESQRRRLHVALQGGAH